ncbi:CHAT domain-containing protein [Micromonospora sp. WMMD714]|uniref:CHAT domain-containing protein n=1 Tax=Micromonospora sp. WMMD714 TaxID=3016097 RepID=UPI00249A3DE7|nr:CHAT domain-containing protein [Micromonospora sp. WMMD714]WFE62966.1 CHAT domain-containing protein [Micromonospora sp. WMMD714]
MGQPDRSPPGRRAAITRIAAIQQAALDWTVTDVPGALAELERLAEEFADDRQVRALAEATASALGLLRASPMLDVGGMRAALANLDDLTEAVPGAASAVEPARALMPDLLRAAQAHQEGDTATARALFAALRVRAGELPPGDPLGTALADVAPLLDALYAGTEAQLPDPGPDASDTVHALHLMVRGGLAVRPDDAPDPERVEAGLDDLRAVVASLPGHHPYRVMCLTSLGLGLARRAEMRGTLADVDEAITVLEEARTLAGDATHPAWALVNELRTAMLRRRGREPLARRAALEGLRGYAWQVLRQPEPAAARAAARAAVEAAVGIANGCLANHQPADALRALDAGRGLLLFATTAWRDPYTRLVEAGHRDLADEWRATEQPSPRLRDRVLAALTRDSGLLDPPDLVEIQGALRRLAVDALVYLVPATASSPGWAVIAPVEGPPRYLPLSLLSIGAGTDVERYLTALATRDPATTREVGPIDPDIFADRLDALCGWAWKAAMGPVVGPYLDAERVPRLVLVPMGDLARVPWQAARAPDGTYLVQRVALSQAASARMLCDTAMAERAPTARTGLVLADPDTGDRAGGLRSARLEAYGIHQMFYPGATYVGRRPDGTVSPSGAGSPDDVRSWLRADGTPAGGLLHLASHGVMETAPATASSRLLLAGGDLTADELVEVMTGVDRRPVGLVVLAACHTGRSIHGYDEAYSLGTMFLAAGARSVLSTQWSVPDGETSLLMYMFHHFLVAGGHPPGDALRRAQMWMLDDQRRPPRHMPPALRRMLDDTDPTRVVAWAGFTHWGQ